MPEEEAIQRLAEDLLRDGRVSIPHGHPLLQGRSNVDLFHALVKRLQGLTGEDDHEVHMTTQEDAFLAARKA